MKDVTGRGCHDISGAFYGSATVGERGQLVIPAEARAQMDMAPGDKVLIMRHPIHKGLMLFKLDAVREFLDEYSKVLDGMDMTEAEKADS